MRTFLAVLLALIQIEVPHLGLSKEESERFDSHTKCLLELLSVDPEVRELIK